MHIYIIYNKNVKQANNKNCEKLVTKEKREL